MDEKKPIELRSEKVRSIIGQVPPLLLRYGITIISLSLLMLVALGALIPYYPKISIEVIAAQKANGEICFTAKIPHKVMIQQHNFNFITGYPPVDDAIPARFTLRYMSDTLHLSRSAGWYEVELFPTDTNTPPVKIQEPITFPAKIELEETTYLKWMMRKSEVAL
ncbi:hypothetical protein [Proteiniphilum sp.]|uniref:hypothetical protein n=1 Tax=Proteiniphilum sp. TaxID=1926877 RepID=UPI00331BB936